MTPETRRNAIVSLATERGEISIDTLSRHFGVSLQTIRSDLRDLTAQGLLLRRHGMVAPFARENIAWQQREIVNINGKRWIGEQAAQLLCGAQSCFLGTGTTVEMVARALPENQPLAVLTNNLHAAQLLSQLPGCTLTIAGGRIRKRDLDIIGSDALTFFSRYRVDIGMVSVGGIDEGGDLYDFNDDEVAARLALTASADVTVLVVDSTKFGRTALCRNGHVGDFDYVVSERAPTAQQQAALTQRRTQWLCRDALSPVPPGG